MSGLTKQALLGRAEMIEELRLNAVADQHLRRAGAQAFGRRLEDETQIVAGRLAADHFVELFAVAQRRPHSLLQGVVDEPFGAKLEECPMTEVLLRRPGEEFDGERIRDEEAEPLARPIPIDQEHEPRAEPL